MELPRFSYAVQCLAEAAITMSTAAEALALAAQAFSSASAELDNLCDSSEHIGNTDVSASLGTQFDDGHSGLKVDPAIYAVVQGGDRSNVVDNDYYFSDDDNEKYITALLKRQQSPTLRPEVEKATAERASPASHEPLAASYTSSVPADPQQSAAHPNDPPEPVICFERHLLVDLESGVIPTICALTQRFPKVVCYMQCALPSIMIYHRIIKQVTETTVYAVTRPNISQSDNTWGAFNRQEKAILLLPETLSSNAPIPALGNICVIHVGWPSSAQRYRSQLELHDAPCSVLVACIHDRQIFPSSNELISETAPWPAEDRQLLMNEVSYLFPKFEAVLLGIPRAIKDKYYQDWIEAHGPRGHRYVSSWDAITLVNRANMYICDVLGYNSSNKDWSLPRTPPVSHEFVSQNALDSALDTGLLVLIEEDPGPSHRMDLLKDARPISKPIPTTVPAESLTEAARQTESTITITASKLQESDLSRKKVETSAPGSQSVVPGARTPEVRLESGNPISATDTNNIHPVAADDSNKPESVSKRALVKTGEYSVVLEDFHLIPAICMLAKDPSCKNIICYVQIVGVIQTLITQIHALTSRPIFIVASPNSAALPGALKAFDSPIGGIVFCNYLHPPCQPLYSKTIHRIIHAGWTGKPEVYSQQMKTTSNAPSSMIMSQSQYLGIPDPNALFGESQLNMTRKVLDPARFDTIVSKWENQLNHASEKALNACYMEWLAYYGKGPYKVETWSTIELVMQANIFGEKVLRRKGSPTTLAASEGFVRHLKLQPAVQAGVLRVTKH